MITTVILFKGLKATASQILTIVMAFLVICCGITILQMSKIDPTELGKKLDRRSDEHDGDGGNVGPAASDTLVEAQRSRGVVPALMARSFHARRLSGRAFD